MRLRSISFSISAILAVLNLALLPMLVGNLKLCIDGQDNLLANTYVTTSYSFKPQKDYPNKISSKLDTYLDKKLNCHHVFKSKIVLEKHHTLHNDFLRLLKSNGPRSPPYT